MGGGGQREHSVKRLFIGILIGLLCLLVFVSCEEAEDIQKGDITLRVATYNIQNGAGVGHDMSLLAEDIKAMELDVIGLQEVDICTSRALGLDTLKLLAEAVGYPYYAFTKAIDFAGGEYGTAILSRYPITAHESVELDTPAGYERRAYGHATIDVAGTEIHFFNTHLSWEDVTLRMPQLAAVTNAVKGYTNYVVSGDFNTDDLREFAVFEGSKLVNTGGYKTFIAGGTAIDNLIIPAPWSITDSGMHVSGRSDHNMLWAEIKFEK